MNTKPVILYKQQIIPNISHAMPNQITKYNDANKDIKNDDIISLFRTKIKEKCFIKNNNNIDYDEGHCDEGHWLE